MSRNFQSATPAYLSLASGVVTAMPLTLAAWARSGSPSLGQTAVSLSDGTGNNTYQLWMAGGVGGDPVRASVTDGGTTNSATTSSGYSTGVWHHLCGVFTSSTLRAAFIDGGSKGTDTTSTSPTGINTTEIGIFAGASRPFQGNLAEIAIWNVALTDAEVAELALGVAPVFVRGNALVSWWRLIGTGLYDEIGGALMTNNSSTVQPTHPSPIFHPAGGSIIVPTAAAAFSPVWDLHSGGGSKSDGAIHELGPVPAG